jgi:hypothetical protein
MSVVLFLKKHKDEKWKTYCVGSPNPTWNENFALPLTPDSITKGKQLPFYLQK